MLNCHYCNISPSPAALSTSGIVTRERERLLVPVHPHNFNLLKDDDDLSIYYGKVWEDLVWFVWSQLQPSTQEEEQTES